MMSRVYMFKTKSFKTVKTVLRRRVSTTTSLKPGVNEKRGVGCCLGSTAFDVLSVTPGFSQVVSWHWRLRAVSTAFLLFGCLDTSSRFEASCSAPILHFYDNRCSHFAQDGNELRNPSI